MIFNEIMRVLMKRLIEKEEQRKHTRRIFDNYDVTGENYIVTSQLKEAM